MKRKILAMLSLVLVLALVPTFVFGAKSKELSGGESNNESAIGGIYKPGNAVIPGIGTEGSNGPGIPAIPGTPVDPSTQPAPGTPGGVKPVQVVKPDGTISSEICNHGIGTSSSCWRHVDEDVKTLADGTMLYTTGATRDKGETWYRLAFNQKTSNGTQIRSNKIGGVAVGDVNVHFASDEAELAGLPDYIKAQINALNSGKTAAEVFGNTLGVDLNGYASVGKTRAVILTDYSTGRFETGTEFFVEVSPLDPNGTYAVVYYNNMNNTWNFMPVSVDPTTKLIKMYLPGSCTIQLLRKN